MSLGLKLRPLHKKLLLSALGILWLTGAAWCFYRFVYGYGGDTTPRNEIQSTVMKIHGGVALAALLLLGALDEHVLMGLKGRKNRATGITMLVTVLVLTITAWMLYYVASDSVRWSASLVHLVIGLIVLPVILVHLRGGRR